MSGAGGSGGRNPVVPVWIGAILAVLLGGYLIIANRTPAPQGPADGIPAPGAAPDVVPAAAPEERTDEAFVLAVLADTERAWGPILQATGSSYAPPAPVLFRGDAPSACGYLEVPRGPFYCLAERAVYLDLDYLGELRQRFRGQGQPGGKPTSEATGDFAAAYVIAHEVGHHVQNLLGTAELARQLLETPPGEEDVGPIALMVELQADCYAGMWAQRAAVLGDFPGQGDVGEALAAASAIGNDRLLGRPRGTVMPDPFTHGTADQRVRWFRTGLGAGDIQACETFAVPDL